MFLTIICIQSKQKTFTPIIEQVNLHWIDRINYNHGVKRMTASNELLLTSSSSSSELATNAARSVKISFWNIISYLRNLLASNIQHICSNFRLSFYSNNVKITVLLHIVKMAVSSMGMNTIPLPTSRQQTQKIET